MTFNYLIFEYNHVVFIQQDFWTRLIPHVSLISKRSLLNTSAEPSDPFSTRLPRTDTWAPPAIRPSARLLRSSSPPSKQQLRNEESVFEEKKTGQFLKNIRKKPHQHLLVPSSFFHFCRNIIIKIVSFFADLLNYDDVQFDEISSAVKVSEIQNTVRFWYLK